MTHPEFRRKLEAVGFGVFIPIFFVSSGVRYDLGALVGSASTVAMVPLFLAGAPGRAWAPALLYRSLLDGRETLVAGLLQATSLPFIVAATAIGQELGLIDAAESAALVGGGLLSVLVFPALGLALLRRDPGVTDRAPRDKTPTTDRRESPCRRTAPHSPPRPRRTPPSTDCSPRAPGAPRSAC